MAKLLKKQLEGERVCFVSELEGAAVHCDGWSVVAGAWDAWSHCIWSQKVKRWMNADIPLATSSLFRLRLQPTEPLLPQSEWVFPWEAPWKHPKRPMQRLVSWVVLKPIRLTGLPITVDSREKQLEVWGRHWTGDLRWRHCWANDLPTVAASLFRLPGATSEQSVVVHNTYSRSVPEYIFLFPTKT